MRFVYKRYVVLLKNAKQFALDVELGAMFDYFLRHSELSTNIRLDKTCYTCSSLSNLNVS